MLAASLSSENLWAAAACDSFSFALRLREKSRDQFSTKQQQQLQRRPQNSSARPQK